MANMPKNPATMVLPQRPLYSHVSEGGALPHHPDLPTQPLHQEDGGHNIPVVWLEHHRRHYDQHPVRPPGGDG